MLTILLCSKYADSMALDVSRKDPNIQVLHKSPERIPKMFLDAVILNYFKHTLHRHIYRSNIAQNYTKAISI